MLTHFEVDGVRAIAAKRSGPPAAGLVFRVGRADETLVTAGITHMTEHLALHRFGLADHEIGGSTGPDHTDFRMQGPAEDVAGFLAGVCLSLPNLPMNRLETEKSILRTEESGKQNPTGLYRRRYGLQGYGLLDCRELGVPRLRAEDVAHWARTWFTRENAILWVAGETVPSGLRLPLPSGAYRPVPERPAVLAATPAYFPAGTGQVIFSSVVRHSPAARIYAKVLERALFRSLRQDGGFSYTAGTLYRLRGDGMADVIAVADALPDKEGAVLGGAIDVLAQFKVGRIDPRDLDAARNQAETALYGADGVAARLPDQAANLLSGLPYESTEEEIAGLRAVDVAAVHAVAIEAASTLLMRVPARHRADWAGFTALTRYSTHALTGHQFRAHEDPEYQLVLAPDGAGQLTPEGPVTVRYADAAALLVWPDGGRELVGRDGTVLALEPTLYEGLVAPMLAGVDAAVGPQRILPQPARAPAEIPRPPAKVATPTSPARGLKRAYLTIIGIASIFGVFGTMPIIWPESDSSNSAGDLLDAIVLWLICLGILSLCFVVRHRAKRL